MVVAKALRDKMKPGIVAKLCSLCGELYGALARSMERESVKGILDAAWLNTAKGKQALYQGLAQFHQVRKLSSVQKMVVLLQHYRRYDSGPGSGSRVGLINFLAIPDPASDSEKQNDNSYSVVMITALNPDPESDFDSDSEKSEIVTPPFITYCMIEPHLSEHKYVSLFVLQAKVCNDSKVVGEEIARLECAKTLLATVTSISSSNSNLCDVKEWSRQTEKCLETANRDNDMIYHEQVAVVDFVHVII